MRVVTWNCCMALHRKFDALLRLQPDIAIICECAEPKRLAASGLNGLSSEPVWIGHLAGGVGWQKILGLALIPAACSPSQRAPGFTITGSRTIPSDTVPTRARLWMRRLVGLQFLAKRLDVVVRRLQRRRLVVVRGFRFLHGFDQCRHKLLVLHFQKPTRACGGFVSR